MHDIHPPALQVPSQKFPRNGSGFNHKGWVEDSMSRSDSGYPFQVSVLPVSRRLVLSELFKCEAQEMFPNILFRMVMYGGSSYKRVQKGKLCEWI